MSCSNKRSFLPAIKWNLAKLQLICLECLFWICTLSICFCTLNFCISSVKQSFIRMNIPHCVKSVHILNFSGLCFVSVLFYPRIWTKYGDLFCKYPYSVQMLQNMDQKNAEYRHYLLNDKPNRLCTFNS